MPSSTSGGLLNSVTTKPGVEPSGLVAGAAFWRTLKPKNDWLKPPENGVGRESSEVGTERWRRHLFERYVQITLRHLSSRGSLPDESVLDSEMKGSETRCAHGPSTH